MDRLKAIFSQALDLRYRPIRVDRCDAAPACTASEHTQPAASNLHAPGAGRRAVHRFTLVELLMAMVILSVIMMLMFRFTTAASDAWTKSAANMRIYNNARAALDLIEQDLRAIVISGETGAEIRLHVYGPGSDQLTFVAATGEDSAYDTELVEVMYDLDGSVLKRAEVGDNSGGWNFLGAPAGWYTNDSASFNEVIGGVQSLKFTVYNAAGSEIAGAGDYTDIARVRIDMTLRDEQTLVDSIAAQAEREFTRTIFLHR